MKFRATLAPLKLLLVACWALFVSVTANASGEIGDHVNDLKAHLDEYTEEVRWMIARTDDMVAAYGDGGVKAAQPAKLVDHWESVKVHAAIETTLIPVYAEIWQGIVGIQQAMNQGKAPAAVTEQRAALAHALWQGLGAVRLRAQQQADGAVARPETAAEPAGYAATLGEIRANLESVVAKYADGQADAAKELVYSTYATRFEGLEGDLIEQDADLVEDLEKDFNATLPQALKETGAVAKVKAVVGAMQEKLDRAEALLEKAEANRKDVF